MKKCSKCKLIKEFECFCKDKYTKTGYHPACKECVNSTRSKEWSNNYYKEHIEEIKEYRAETRDVRLAKKKIYHKEHADIDQKWREDNRERSLEVQREYRNKLIKNGFCIKHPTIKSVTKRHCADCAFKVNIRTRCRMGFVKKGYSKDSKTHELLGADYETIKVYIESLFSPGMTWENNTVHGWHIDHKIPLCSAKTKEELIILCHYTNLQPLWAKDNLKKNGKF